MSLIEIILFVLWSLVWIFDYLLVPIQGSHLRGGRRIFRILIITDSQEPWESKGDSSLRILLHNQKTLGLTLWKIWMQIEMEMYHICILQSQQQPCVLGRETSRHTWPPRPSQHRTSGQVWDLGGSGSRALVLESHWTSDSQHVGGVVRQWIQSPAICEKLSMYLYIFECLVCKNLSEIFNLC